MIFNQDNAPSHKASFTQTAIQQLTFEVLDHPPYSPDLPPCDYVFISDIVFCNYHNELNVKRAITNNNSPLVYYKN